MVIFGDCCVGWLIERFAAARNPRCFVLVFMVITMGPVTPPNVLFLCLLGRKIVSQAKPRRTVVGPLCAAFGRNHMRRFVLELLHHTCCRCCGVVPENGSS